jgi:DNA-binding MarR family transcriptional regulator
METISETNSIEKAISLVFTTGRLMRERAAGRHKMDPNTVLQMETLRYVEDNGIPAMKDVARYLCIAPPSATSLIEHLVKTGLLQRAGDEEDRRVTRLSITSRGHTVMMRSRSQIHGRMKEVLGHLNSKERLHLIQILQKLSKTYEKKLAA